MVATKVSYDNTNKVIRVQALGAETILDWETSKMQVIQLSSEHNCNKVLVDARDQTAAPTTMELFYFTESWPINIRVTKLIGPVTREDQHFVETVAVNRGIPMKDFMNECDAMAWLN